MADKTYRELPEEQIWKIIENHEKWLRGNGNKGKKAKLRNVNLKGMDLKCVDLSGAILSEANLSEANLSEANLSGANLSGANLSGANFSEANLNDADLSGTNLSGTNFTRAFLRNSDLSETNLNGTKFDGVSLDHSRFIGVELNNTSFEDANLREALFENARSLSQSGTIGDYFQSQYFTGPVNFKNSDLTRTRFLNSTINNADLTWARIHGTEFEDSTFPNADLRKSNIKRSVIKRSSFQGCDFRGVTFAGAVFAEETKLDGSFISNCHFLKCDFHDIEIFDADFTKARFIKSKIRKSSLSGVKFNGASLRSNSILDSHLNDCNWTDADLTYADLSGSNFNNTDLSDAKFAFSVSDGNTIFVDCRINSRTDFTGVGLGNPRMDPGMRQTLEYNIRRKRWEQWYKANCCLKTVPTRIFWWVSDYGRSTIRTLMTFFIATVVFTMIYIATAICPCPSPTPNPETCECTLSPEYALTESGSYTVTFIKCKDRGLIKNLFYDSDKGKPISWKTGIVRAFYFSTVTMTTLGFGDMHAMTDSIAGYFFLSLQVIFGYFLLGALVTRLSVLFTTDGPEMKLEDE